jgi:hypothetical protein
MKTIKLLFLSALAVLYATTGCIEDFTITGNGITTSEGRITSNFNKVKSEGDFNVHITSGNEFQVVVNAESNIIPYIETNVNGGTLRIYIRGIHSVNNRRPMEVYVTMPNLKGVTQSGSGVITTGFFTTDNFSAVISGSGSIETAVETLKTDAVISGSGNLFLSGETYSADFLISGSGKIDAYHFNVSDCDARISGSGNIWVNVDRFLKASISGSGNVFYYGAPLVEKQISGSGDVIRKN